MSFPELLRVYQYDNKIRCGVNKDGGYVIGDINDESGYDCYISAGVSNEESFSRDFLNKYNINKNVNHINTYSRNISILFNI